MNAKAYVKAANRGDFQWYPIEEDDWTGQVLEEGCEYKGKCAGVRISGTKGEYEIEIDGLENEPLYICDTRSSRKSARMFAERTIRNDREGSSKANLKYVNY